MRKENRSQHRSIIAGLVGLMTTFGAMPTKAQVNVETIRRKIKGDGVTFETDAASQVRVGNTNTLILGTISHVGLGSGSHFGFVSGRLDYALINDVVASSRSFIHGRYNYLLTSAPFDLFFEVFGQVQQDKFQLLSLRKLVGAGLRVGLAKRTQVELWSGLSYMLEHERRNIPEDGEYPAERTMQRANLYLSLLVPAGSDRVSFGLTTYFQPRFNSFADFRWLLESSLTFEVSKRFAARTSLFIRTDSHPPPAVKSTDVEVRNAIVFSL